MLNGKSRNIHRLQGVAYLALSTALGAVETPSVKPTEEFLADSLSQFDNAQPALQTPDLLPALINVAVSLCFVILLIYAIYWGLRRWQASRGISNSFGNQSAIRVLEKNFLDAKRGLAVVEIGEEIFYLGLGEDVSVLARISDPDAVEKIRGLTPGTGGFTSFPEQMEKVSNYLRRDQWQKSKDTLRGETESLKASGQRLRQNRGSRRDK